MADSTLDSTTTKCSCVNCGDKCQCVEECNEKDGCCSCVCTGYDGSSCQCNKCYCTKECCATAKYSCSVNCFCGPSYGCGDQCKGDTVGCCPCVCQGCDGSSCKFEKDECFYGKTCCAVES